MRVVCRQRNCGPVAREVRTLRIPDARRSAARVRRLVQRHRRVGRRRLRHVARAPRRRRHLLPVHQALAARRSRLQRAGDDGPRRRGRRARLGPAAVRRRHPAPRAAPGPHRARAGDLACPDPRSGSSSSPRRSPTGVNALQSIPEGARLRLKSGFRLRTPAARRQPALRRRDRHGAAHVRRDRRRPLDHADALRRPQRLRHAAARQRAAGHRAAATSTSCRPARCCATRRWIARSRRSRDDARTRSRSPPWARVLLAVALGGCGVEVGGDDSGTAAAVQQSTPAQQRARARRAASLPQRADGELAIAGEHQGSLSSNAVQPLPGRPEHGATRATAPSGRTRALPASAAARSTSSTRRARSRAPSWPSATPTVWRSARRSRSPPTRSSLATRNESDVGGDCLTVADVRELYRRDSPIDNWNDLGFDDLALTAAGPDADRQRVLELRLAGARRAERRDARRPAQRLPRARLRRRHPQGDPRREPAAARAHARRGAGAARPRATRARQRRALHRQRCRRRRAIACCAQIAIQNRLRAAPQAGRRRSRRAAPGATSAASSAPRTAPAAAPAGSTTPATTSCARRARVSCSPAPAAPGVIGFVRFSYYEAFEDQLRPMEIDPGAARDAAVAAADARTRSAGLTPPQRRPATDADGNRIPNCIFPSQQTITTGEYPLLAADPALHVDERPASAPRCARSSRTRCATRRRWRPRAGSCRSPTSCASTSTGSSPAPRRRPSEKPLPGEQTAATDARDHDDDHHDPRPARRAPPPRRPPRPPARRRPRSPPRPDLPAASPASRATPPRVRRSHRDTSTSHRWVICPRSSIRPPGAIEGRARPARMVESRAIATLTQALVEAEHRALLAEDELEDVGAAARAARRRAGQGARRVRAPARRAARDRAGRAGGRRAQHAARRRSSPSSSALHAELAAAARRPSASGSRNVGGS